MHQIENQIILSILLSCQKCGYRVRRCGLGALLWVLFPVAVRAYTADAITGPDSVTLETRLYLSASTPAPVSHWVWFVADVNRDGVPTAPSAGNILGGDDQLIFQDTIDGGLLGDNPGRYRRANITVDDAYAAANMVVYLWVVSSPALVGQAGQTFGMANLGVVTPPEFGSADWVISQSVLADQYLVLGATAVAAPEPATILLLSAGGCLLVVHRRRVFQPRPCGHSARSRSLSSAVQSTVE